MEATPCIPDVHGLSKPPLGGACVERPSLGYLRVDPLNPMEASHTHAVVAVNHEVSPTQLQQAHRGQLLPETKGSVDPLPLLRRSLGEGHKVRVELLVLAYATDYPRYLDGPPASIHTPTSRNTPSGLLRGEEGASSTIPSKQQLLQPA